MIEFYAQIKAVHIAAVIASGLLFLARGAAVQLGASWAMAGAVRYLSYTIDTVLLTAALMLATILHQFPFVQGWLTAKVLLLVVYVVLGTFALKRGRTRVVRATCWLAAMGVYLFIVSIARTHQPLGIFSLLTR
ncbi:MAG TPA: SirB2 family protein [Steroidobacteraceae bacterium]|nr:SirB2 family protein [Steroidobacteraceae bacterium]